MSNLSKYTVKLLNSREELSLHSKEVQELASNFGVYLGLGLRDIKNLRIGGFIHDIGKLNLPEEILFKEGKLTNEEFELIKGHPVVGYEMLSGVKHPFSKDVLDMVLQHHERVDGRGYPYNLKNDEINPLAKIISLCDVFSAILAVRSYKKSRSVENALGEIEKGLGTQFDEFLGKKFITFINESYLEKINKHSSIL